MIAYELRYFEMTFNNVFKNKIRLCQYQYFYNFDF